MNFKIKHLLVISIVLISTSVNAGKEGIDSFFAEYLEAFSLGQDVSDYYVGSPHFIFGSHLLAPISRKETAEVLKDIRVKLEQAGYAGTAVNQLKIRVEVDRYYLVTLRLERYKSSGEALDVVCSTYGVLSGEQGYEILSWQPGSVNIEGQCD